MRHNERKKLAFLIGPSLSVGRLFLSRFLAFEGETAGAVIHNQKARMNKHCRGSERKAINRAKYKNFVLIHSLKLRSFYTALFIQLQSRLLLIMHPAKCI